MVTNRTAKTETSGGTSVVPAHLAVIMDGNGRWARMRGMPRVAGHRKGGDAVRRLIELSRSAGISWLTVFAFSSENWKRPQEEVDRLMELFVQALDKDVKELHANNIRFRVIGNTDVLRPAVKSRILESESLTRSNTGMIFTVALNYGGRWDIGQACRKIAEEISEGTIEPSSVNEEMVERYLSTHGMPEPDLFIRTGGEKRISNFLLWQLAYTELYFSDVLWPDFGEKELQSALDAYASRQRRFGKTGEQIEAV